MGKGSRVKGSGYEREICHWHTDRGIPAERVPLSGQSKGSYSADIRIGPSLAVTGECKRFKNGLGKLYDALEQDNADVVFARADRKETVVCMKMEMWEAVVEWMEWKE